MKRSQDGVHSAGSRFQDTIKGVGKTETHLSQKLSLTSNIPPFLSHSSFPCGLVTFRFPFCLLSSSDGRFGFHSSFQTWTWFLPKVKMSVQSWGWKWPQTTVSEAGWKGIMLNDKMVLVLCLKKGCNEKRTTEAVNAKGRGNISISFE